MQTNTSGSKRKKAAVGSDKNAKKGKQQASIANFFSQPKLKKEQDEKESDLQDEKENDLQDEKVDTTRTEEQQEEQENEQPAKPDFFTTSMYTDEFNNMLESVLESESFLFNQEENQTFDTFRSLKGFLIYLLRSSTITGKKLTSCFSAT